MTRPPTISSLLAARLQGFRAADAVLALLVLATVGIMIIPLPTWVIDLLIAGNLSIAVSILLVVLYVPDAIAVASFPTLLLLTTLFRLALNIASTRLILLQADAGEMIKAFGHFVVRGNYLVGAVIFVVLTVVQLVVIAKGAERVAEVGARFALDAMPGKQMAIDAELRSGSIDGNEARRRRRHLSRESQFYGAMDGAMKFVKGDVIASLVITVVNILAGLTLGVVQRGMTAGDALKRYGLLTIGDGLVTQIPALLLSTAAGVLVTRVASEEADTPLGEELARQIFGAPRALKLASIFVAALGVVPGLPTLPFFVMAAGLFMLARVRSGQLASDAAAESAAATESTATPRRDHPFVPMIVPWSVEVSPDLAPLLEPRLRATVLGLRARLFSELGVPLPPPRIRVHPELPARHAAISVHEIPMLVPVAEGLADDAVVALIADRAHAVLRARAADFLGLTETQRLLDELEPFAPATVRNVVPKPVSLPLLTDILRRLADEGISVRDLRGILEALSAVAATEKDPLALAEYVRGQLRRTITFRFTGGAPRLDVFLLDAVFEETVRRAITRTPAGAFLALAPHAARDILTALRRTLSTTPTGDGPRVVLTPPDIRRFVRKLVEPDLPELHVLSYAELLPEVALRPIGKASPISGVADG